MPEQSRPRTDQPRADRPRSGQSAPGAPLAVEPSQRIGAPTRPLAR
ncbi:hypothetical protein ACWEPB_00005 [Kitasatospora cineracea]